jgi:C4-dicarboxylate-specific signal transduction histidine kinase
MFTHEQKEVRFFGQITAAATHEMKNVLAIIKETAGLMEDLAALSDEMPPPLREKCQNTLSVIQNQIQRGVDISDHLNRFAHSTDVQTASVDLNTAVSQIASLAQRFARLKKVELEAEPSRATMTVQVRPVLLLMTLFSCIQCCLNALSPGSRIRIVSEASDAGFEISFVCKGKDSSPEELFSAITAGGVWSELEQTAAALGGTVHLDAHGLRIRLQLPESLS